MQNDIVSFKTKEQNDKGSSYIKEQNDIGSSRLHNRKPQVVEDYRVERHKQVID